MLLSGSIPAIVTPFRDGQVDHDTLEPLIFWHVDQGSHGIVALGTTGESATLSHDEHDAVMGTAVRAAANRLPVVVGTGSNSTEEAIRLTRRASDIGATAALIVAPYYNNPNQEGIFRHFEAVHDSCDLPIVIYNIPGRTVVDMRSA